MIEHMLEREKRENQKRAEKIMLGVKKDSRGEKGTKAEERKWRGGKKDSMQDDTESKSRSERK